MHLLPRPGVKGKSQVTDILNMGAWAHRRPPQNFYAWAEMHASFGQNIKNSEKLCYVRKNVCMCTMRKSQDRENYQKGKMFLVCPKIFLYVCEIKVRVIKENFLICPETFLYVFENYGILGKIFVYVWEKFWGGEMLISDGREN
jgi:hypothetical protein